MVKIDLHIHSIASGHAFNTIYEIVNDSVEKDMELIAITDHGPDMKGAPHLEYFTMSHRVPKRLNNINVLFGCEANIINHNGTVDLPIEILSQLDIVVVGFHKLTQYPVSSSKQQNTDAMISAMIKYPINIISHPYRNEFPVIVDSIAEVAAQHNVVLELNNSIFYNPTPSLIAETKNLIQSIKKYGGKCIIGSDAHILSEIGSNDDIKKYWNELEVDDDILISTQEDYFNYVN